jgi:hypothetical protein
MEEVTALSLGQSLPLAINGADLQANLLFFVGVMPLLFHLYHLAIDHLLSHGTAQLLGIAPPATRKGGGGAPVGQ